MALRLHLAPQAVSTLSRCPAALREQVQHELGALLAAPPPPPPAPWLAPAPASAWGATLLLHSGVRVRYLLDSARGLLQLLDLRAPVEPPSIQGA